MKNKELVDEKIEEKIQINSDVIESFMYKGKTENGLKYIKVNKR